MQTHLPFPYDCDARNGNNPHDRATLHRHAGIRGRADVTNREISSADSLMQIEDYLIEEAALEMAFEGNRWADLLRIAMRRNDPAFLADKVYDKLSKEGNPAAEAVDRKSVVSGKSVSVRVDLGGRRIIKKKKNKRRRNNYKKK